MAFLLLILPVVLHSTYMTLLFPLGLRFLMHGNNSWSWAKLKTVKWGRKIQIVSFDGPNKSDATNVVMW